MAASFLDLDFTAGIADVEETTALGLAIKSRLLLTTPSPGLPPENEGMAASIVHLCKHGWGDPRRRRVASTG